MACHSQDRLLLFQDSFIKADLAQIPINTHTLHPIILLSIHSSITMPNYNTMSPTSRLQRALASGSSAQTSQSNTEAAGLFKSPYFHRFYDNNPSSDENGVDESFGWVDQQQPETTVADWFDPGDEQNQAPEASAVDDGVNWDAWVGENLARVRSWDDYQHEVSVDKTCRRPEEPRGETNSGSAAERGDDVDNGVHDTSTGFSFSIGNYACCNLEIYSSTFRSQGSQQQQYATTETPQTANFECESQERLVYPKEAMEAGVQDSKNP